MSEELKEIILVIGTSKCCENVLRVSGRMIGEEITALGNVAEFGGLTSVFHYQIIDNKNIKLRAFSEVEIKENLTCFRTCDR